MNYTAIGSIAILIWGFSLPIGRIIQEQIGPVAYLGIVFLVTGILTFAQQGFRLSLSPSERSCPAFYMRWLFFVMHEALILISVGIVSLPHMPIVILINYLWPTAIIIASIFIAGVQVYRPILFILGTAIVIASLAFELLGSTQLHNDIFAHSTDNIAYILTFLGAISWGLYCAISKRYGAITGEARPIALFQLTLGMALPFSLVPQLGHPWNMTFSGVMILCGMCIAQVIAYRAWDTGMRLGNIVILSLLADLIPWLSLLGTALILGVEISFRTILSAFCLVVGAIITRFATRTPFVLAKEDLEIA